MKSLKAGTKTTIPPWQVIIAASVLELESYEGIDVTVDDETDRRLDDEEDMPPLPSTGLEDDLSVQPRSGQGTETGTEQTAS